MSRIKLKDRVLPEYSPGEEIFNMVSHIVGASIGIAILVLCVIFAAVHHDPYEVVASSIFGTTIILLYTMSSIYHGLPKDTTAKKVFQIIDHCTIFLLIAGSYTPFALGPLREYSTALGWSIFGIIWGLAILGIVLNSIDLKSYKVFSLICYILMGWLIVFKIHLLPGMITWTGVILLAAGGLCYTIGEVFYVWGKKKKWMHSIFHLLCIAGTVCQGLCIMLFVV